MDLIVELEEFDEDEVLNTSMELVDTAKFDFIMQ